MSQTTITVYSPESPLRNPGKLFASMWRDLLASRELAWRLFVRDISAQYRQSLLGYVWAFLPPIATTFTFVFLSRQRILNVSDPGMPYVLFVAIGTVLWQTFVDAINSPIKMVQSSKAMLAKINFPREALILAGLAEVFFNFAIRALVLIPIFLWYQFSIPLTSLLVPIGVIVLIAFGLTLGILLTPLGMLYSDIGRGLTMITGFWMLLTPVVYPVPKAGFAAAIASWNPVAPLIVTTREWLALGPSSHLPAFLAIVACTVLFLMVGWLGYRIAMPHIISRMGG